LYPPAASPIEVARFVKYRGSDWAATVGAIRKVVDHGFLPTAAGEAELENLSRAEQPPKVVP
jgi:hypothetical protein